MTIILSIKPEYADLIFAGKKVYEYRRRFTKKRVDRIIIYATKPASMILGEARVKKVHYDSVENLWENTQCFGGVNKSFFFEYFRNCSEGFALEIEKPQKYSNPKQLSRLNISHPPQSFQFLSH